MSKDESAEEIAKRLREFLSGLPKQVIEHALMQRMVERLSRS
jgi:hypothetical protein